MDPDALADFPAENDVRDGVGYGGTQALVGNVVLPAAGDVRDGVGYDSNSSVIGTLDTTGEADLPAIEDVQDGVSYNNGALIGVLGLPLESEVLKDVGYGANDIEYVGQLEASSGAPSGPVMPNGQLRSPLVIGRDYINQYGTGFVWKLDLPFDPSSEQAFFRGRRRATGCPGDSCPATYDWEVEDLSISASGEFVFNMLADETPTVADEYDWWLVWEDTSGQEIQLLAGAVRWVCG